MSKRLILVLALALVVGLTFASAYAEVQNVKVSGDLTVKAVARNNFDLAKPSVSSTNTNGGNGAGPTGVTTTYSDKEQDMLSIARVRIDADLTDNVSTTIRLLNERNWNGDSGTPVEANRNIGLAVPTGIVDEQAIDIDLAYVTMKEFLYSPLTLTIGRQELKFGNGWIVGDPDTNGMSGRSALAEGDLSSRKAFDAVRATFDYNPLVLDMIYAKVKEGSSILNDDVTLSGINAAYALSKTTSLEGFFFSKVTDSNSAAVAHVDAGLQANGNAAPAASWQTAAGVGTTTKQKSDIVNTLGGRVVNKSIKNLTLDAEAAWQFGMYNPAFDTNARIGRDPNNTTAQAAYRDVYATTAPRQAWGTILMANYDLKDVPKLSKYIAKYSPSITGVYAYLSGASRDRTSKSYNGWDPMFEDITFGHIQNAIMGFSNCHLLGLTGQMKPKDDVTAKLTYVASWFAKRYPEGRAAVLSGVGVAGAQQFTMTKNPFIGHEIDGEVTYDYTEDVQLSLLGGIFLPGKAINDNSQVTGVTGGGNGSNNSTGASNVQRRAVATELIGSMKVTF